MALGLTESSWRTGAGLQPRSGFGYSSSAVVILIADDVGFIERSTVLHFDEDQRPRAGAFDPMTCAGWDINRRTRAYGHSQIVERDDTFAAHHEPVLRTMAVRLKREPLTGRHLNDLDLVACFLLMQNGVTAPRPERAFLHG